ncbi:M20 family metallo-hydrolase [Desulfoplanes sp.]
MLQTIIDHLADTTEEAVSLQRDLVAIPALGPTCGGQGEKNKADYLLGYLKTLDISDILEIKVPDNRVDCGYRPNIVARIPGRDPSRTLWIISHTDVVPVGDGTLWKTPPFELHREGDLIFGRGVEDNHQGLVSSLLLAKALLEKGGTPSINLGLVFVADEETGSRYGLDALVKDHANLFNENDMFLIPDGGAPDSGMIEIAEKSQLWVKATVTGKQCHASRPHLGINSLKGVSALVLKLDRLHEIFPDQDPIFVPPISTFTPTKKESNVDNINTMPGRDVVYIDSRVLPHVNVDDVLGAMRRLGDEVAEEYSVSVDFEVVQREDAAPATEPGSDIVVRLKEAIQEIYQVEGRAQGIGGGTVAAFLRRQGYAAVVWSTLMNYAHQPNEQSSISNTIKDAQVMACLLF